MLHCICLTNKDLKKRSWFVLKMFEKRLIVLGCFIVLLSIIVDITLAQNLQPIFGKPDNSNPPVFSRDGDCPGIFGYHVDYMVNSKPISIYTGDLNGDDYPDVAVACYWREMLSVILNNGDGTFGGFDWYYIPYYSECVDGADLDNDGDIDMITANSDDNNVAVLLNYGDGSFALRTFYVVGGNPRSVVAANLDDDDDIDLVAANYWNGRISVLLNNGDATFANYIPYSVEGNPRSVFAADLDGDGDKDIITANLNSNTASLLFNDGNGNFALDSVRPVGSEPFSVYAADFNGDDKVDIAAANSGDGTVSVLINSGSAGTFNPQVVYQVCGRPTSVIAFDVDNDNDLDLATANSDSFIVSVLLNDGNANFGFHTVYATGHNPYSLKAADFDGDDDLDLAIALFTSNYISVLNNLNSLPFTGSVAGQVTNDLADPVEDVLVFAVGDSNNDITDINGEYNLGDICCGIYDVYFSHPEYCDTIVNDIRIAPDDITNLDVTLNFRSIAGTITDQDLMPIEGVIIDLSASGISDTTGFDGKFYFGGLSNGPHNLEFSHPHYCDMSIIGINAPLNDTVIVDVIMNPRGFVKGIVSDEMDQPIQDILVTAVNTIKYDSTNIDGEYFLSYLNAGVYNISFESIFYYDTVVSDISVISADTTTLDISLRHRPDIEIWYGNADSLPIVGRSGAIIAVDVFIRTAGNIALNSADLILGADNQYIADLLGESAGKYYYPFTEMDNSYFLPPFGSPPNADAWSSQVFSGFFNSEQNSIVFNFNEPVLALRYVVQVIDDLLMIGDTVQCFGQGVDELGYSSKTFNDEGEALTLVEHFSSLYITDRYPYFPGDVNMHNGMWPPQLIGNDVTYLVGYFIGELHNFPCRFNEFWASADITGDCSIIGSDVTRLISYFIAAGEIRYCPEYPPLWIHLNDIPDEAPFGWPNCDADDE